MSKGCLRVVVFQNDTGTSNDMDKSMEGRAKNINNSDSNTTVNKLRSSTSKIENTAKEEVCYGHKSYRFCRGYEVHWRALRANDHIREIT